MTGALDRFLRRGFPSPWPRRRAAPAPATLPAPWVPEAPPLDPNLPGVPTIPPLEPYVVPTIPPLPPAPLDPNPVVARCGACGLELR